MIQEELLPAMTSVFANTLGSETGPENWQLVSSDEDPDGQTLLLHYPKGISRPLTNVPAYIRPMIRLEMEARGDHWPEETKTIVPYAAETFPTLFKDPNCQIKVLAAERTFLEKLTILHGCYHQPQDKPLKDRQSRHYYDVVQLYGTETGKKAIKDHELMKKVALHQTIFFQRAWAKYDEAVPGTFHLVPPDFRKKEIDQDYKKMQEMMIGEAPSLKHIFGMLKEIEDLINAAKIPKD